MAAEEKRLGYANPTDRPGFCLESSVEGDTLNPYFCTNLDSLIKKAQPDLWIHGHTHDSADYRIDRTRVVCNPRGYHGYELNPAFDPGLLVEVST